MFWPEEALRPPGPALATREPGLNHPPPCQPVIAARSPAFHASGPMQRLPPPGLAADVGVAALLRRPAAFSTTSGPARWCTRATCWPRWTKPNSTCSSATSRRIRPISMLTRPAGWWPMWTGGVSCSMACARQSAALRPGIPGVDVAAGGRRESPGMMHAEYAKGAYTVRHRSILSSTPPPHAG